MKLILPLLFALVIPISNPIRAQDPAPKPKAEKKAPVYDEKAVGSEQIATALVHAKRENRRVLIQWGANWCGWCVKLADLEAKNADIKKEILYEYDVVKIDIGTWEALKHKELIAKYGADIAKGVPYLTVLDADGNVVVNQLSDVLESADKDKGGHDPAKVLEFLKTHEAPHLEAKAVYDGALATAKSEGKRVFLHFGAPWCGWCHKLDDWMAKPEINDLLSRDFVMVKIDSDRMVGGAAMLASLRSDKEGGIPWFAFLDANGTMLAECINAKGNIGFPAQPEEIEHFRGMLEKTCVKLSKEQIATLCESLIPPKKPAAEKAPGDKPAKVD